MATSPWGKIQSSHKLATGISLVTIARARHGGVRVTDRIANTRLSLAARWCATKQGGYHWFEEDCDWAIPFFELPELLPSKVLTKTTQQDVLDCLKRWNAVYLQAVTGVAQ